MSRLAAIDYLRVPAGAPWKWEEGGRVLAWSDGTTVLFREELDAIAERLAPSGLPAFPALALLFAACRGKVPDFSTTVDPATPGYGPLMLALQSRQHRQALEEFVRVAQLPPELIARAPGKALLAEAVFEGSARLAPGWSAAVLRGLPEAWGEAELNTAPADVAPLDFTGTLRLVVEGLRPHTAESLARRLRTGLDALPAAAPEIELPREERSRRLLDALGADEEHAGLALVVRDLMAALRLPRTLARTDETAAEGVSDIGNRGPLDRLVLSELAYDDLTLATRVALNEALYLRREPPAQRPQRALAVLIDAGLRMWGVPRVLGTAAALALFARHPAGGAALAWRAAGRAVVPVDLLAKAGLEAHLAALETTAHPGAALPAWRTALAEQPEVDAVVVTHRDALADAAFAAELARTEAARGFLMLVERDGLVQLHALPWGAPRPLAEVRVEVAKLFPRPKAQSASAPLIDENAAGDWPAIFRERPFPLRLPVNAKMALAVPAGGGGLCVTTDNRLLHWEKREHGARLLAADLPGGRACWLHFDQADGRAIAVKGRGGDGRMAIVVATADGREARVARFSGPQHPLTAFINREALLVVLHTRILSMSLTTVEVLAETPIPEGMTWIDGPYFTGPRGPCFVAWDGTAARWDTLAVGHHAAAHEVLAIFDRDGIGAWLLLRDGRLLTPSGSEAMKTGFPLSSARVLENGRRIAVRKVKENSLHVIDVERRTVRVVPSGVVADVPETVTPPTRNLQAKFFSVWATPGAPLRLRKTAGKGGKWLEMFFNPGGSFQLVPADADDDALRAEAREFAPLTTPARLGCRLQVARWPGGSRAWLDSRGLLHLRSGNPAVPEFTLALCFQAALAGWSADGARCGPAFFHDGAKDEPQRFQALLTAFCQHAC